MSAVIDARWSEALALDRRRAPEFYVASSEVAAGAHAEAIRYALKELGLSAVSCINGVPTIGFLSDPAVSIERIDALHRILWNQGLMSLLLVIRSDELTAYSLVQRPLHRDDSQGKDPRLVKTLHLLVDALALRELLDAAESGRFWYENDSYFNPDNRVDSVLLDNLLVAFRSLKGELGTDAAQALLMQTMFVAYLEDRQIIGEAVLAANDVALFFFAGHGMQIEGENYLAPIDVDASDELEAKHSSLALNKVIETMEKGANATSIIVLDACRNNPFARAWSRSAKTRGLAPIYAPRGTLIAHATSPGQVASDGEGRNGAYTEALLKHLATPDCTIENMFKRVRNTLSAATKGKQISWEHTSLADEFFFNLSLGVRIDAYSDTALADGLFVLDESKTSHKVIRGLKSHNWPTQNTAIGGFTVAHAGKASGSSLFVLGRNLYQAACGGSHSAATYITDFPSHTSGLDPAKRKAILDGMLFEVFYDPRAKLRKTFKMGQFQELLVLERHRALAESFQFIAECLLPEIGRFYAIPGKKQQVVVDIVTRAGANPADQILVSVHCAGDDILWLEDDDYKPVPGKAPVREKLALAKFEERLAQEMVVASDLLTINYQSFGKAGRERIHFPYGWTVRRR